MFRMFWQILAVYLAAVNLAAFAAFGIDKWKAVRQRWRIPEATLLGLALAGGALGGWRGCGCSITRPARRVFSWGCL